MSGAEFVLTPLGNAFRTGDEGGEVFSLDLGGAVADASGGVVVRVVLHRDTETRQERLRGLDGTLEWGKRFRSELVEPVTLTLRLDLYALRAVASRAARSKSGRSKSGAVLVRGGKAAKFQRVDE